MFSPLSTLPLSTVSDVTLISFARLNYRESGAPSRHNIMLDENGKIAATPPSWQHAHQILNHSISHIRHRKCFSTEESGGRHQYQQLENGGEKSL